MTIFLYVLVSISFLVGLYSIYREGVWKKKVLTTLEDIHMCAFSANQSAFKLLKLAQSVSEEEVPSFLLDLDVDEDEKVSSR